MQHWESAKARKGNMMLLSLMGDVMESTALAGPNEGKLPEQGVQNEFHVPLLGGSRLCGPPRGPCGPTGQGLETAQRVCDGNPTSCVCGCGQCSWAGHWGD